MLQQELCYVKRSFGKRSKFFKKVRKILYENDRMSEKRGPALFTPSSLQTGKTGAGMIPLAISYTAL